MTEEQMINFIIALAGKYTLAEVYDDIKRQNQPEETQTQAHHLCAIK